MYITPIIDFILSKSLKDNPLPIANVAPGEKSVATSWEVTLDGPSHHNHPEVSLCWNVVPVKKI